MAFDWISIQTQPIHIGHSSERRSGWSERVPAPLSREQRNHSNAFCISWNHSADRVLVSKFKMHSMRSVELIPLDTHRFLANNQTMHRTCEMIESWREFKCPACMDVTTENSVAYSNGISGVEKGLRVFIAVIRYWCRLFHLFDVR